MILSRDAEFKQAIARLDNLPKAILDSEPIPNACAVGDDSVLGGRLATNFPIERGLDRIACLT
jgi:DNA-binding LacI/PurR family transcriptional regulator